MKLLLAIGLQALLLAGIVWALTSLGRRWISPAWRAAMWFLVIARLLIPVAPPSALSLQNLFSEKRVEIAHAPAPTATVVITELPVDSKPGPVTQVATKPLPVAPRFDWEKAFVWVWSGGAAVALAMLLARTLALRRRIHSEAPEEIVAAFEAAKSELRVRHPVRLAVSNEIAAPALAGLLPARLIVPAQQTFSAGELRQIFLHELAHVKLGHLFFHWLGLVARCAHWFNPLAHFAAARMRHECELAADAFALARLSEHEKPTYGETILRAVTGARSPLALAMADDAHHLKQRLRALNDSGARPKALLSLALLILLTACGLTGAKPAEAKLEKTAMAVEQTPLIVRNYRVANPRSFHERVEEELRSLGLHPDPIHTGLPSRLEPAELVARLFSRVLKQRVHASKPNSGQVGFFYNDRTGVIFARATEAQHEQFEAELKRVIGLGYRWIPAPGATRPTTTLTNAVPIRHRLEEIMIDASNFREPAPLEEVLKRLSQETNRVNLGMAAAPDGVSPEKFTINFPSPQGRLTLREFLDRMVAGASPPSGVSSRVKLGYSVEEHAIVFRTVDPGEQVSRMLKISDDAGDAETVLAMIKEAAARAMKGWSGQGQPSVMWNFDRAQRRVLVKAMPELADRFENELMRRMPRAVSGGAARKAEESTQQIHFQTRIIEAAEDQKEKLLEELAAAQEIKATNQLFIAGVSLGAAAKDLPTAAGRGMFEKVAEPIAYSKTVADGVQGVLDPQSAQRFLGRSKAAGATLVSAPSVTTVLGRQARISIVESNTAVTSAKGQLRSNVLEFGPTVDFYPARFDGEHVHFVASADISESLGYVEDKDGKALPCFRIRSVGSDVKIRPGMTQVFSYPAVGADEGAPNRERLAQPAKRRVFILITPTLVDGVGNVAFPEAHAK